MNDVTRSQYNLTAPHASYALTTGEFIAPAVNAMVDGILASANYVRDLFRR